MAVRAWTGRHRDYDQHLTIMAVTVLRVMTMMMMMKDDCNLSLVMGLFGLWLWLLDLAMASG